MTQDLQPCLNSSQITSNAKPHLDSVNLQTRATATKPSQETINEPPCISAFEEKGAIVKVSKLVKCEQLGSDHDIRKVYGDLDAVSKVVAEAAKKIENVRQDLLDVILKTESLDKLKEEIA